MDDTLPNFKVGEPTSNIFQKNNITVSEDSESSFVVLARDVIGSLPHSAFNDEDASQWNSHQERQSLLSSVSHISSVEDTLHQMLEENTKLKQTLEESDAVMKQQFEKIEEWQKELMLVCRDHNQKYMETKKIVDRMRAENDYLRGMLQNQSQNYVNPQSLTKTVSKSENVATSSSSLNTSTASSVFVHVRPFHTPEESIDFSLDKNMTVISLKSDDITETSLAKTQCENTAEMHTNLDNNESVSLIDIENKLHQMIEENRELRDQSEKLAERYKNVMPLCNDQSKTPVEIKNLMNRMTATNDTNTTQSQTENCVKPQTPMASKSENDKTESNNRNAMTTSSVASDKEQSLTQCDSSVKAFESAKLSSSSLDSNITIISLTTTKTTQTPTLKMQCVSTETESVTTCVETQTASETQYASPETKKRSSEIATNTGFEPQSALVISEVTEQIKEAEKNNYNEHTMRLELSFEAFLRRGNPRDNLNAYHKALKEMKNYFTLISCDTEERNIIVECINSTIHAAESIKFKDDGSLIANDLAEYNNEIKNFIKKLGQEYIKIMDDKQKQNKAEQQFHKILSGYSLLINMLAIVTVKTAEMKTYLTLPEEARRRQYVEMEKSLNERNKKLCEERAALRLEQLSLNDEKDQVHAKTEQLLIAIRTIDQEKQRMANERKGLQSVKEIDDHQEQLHNVEKSVLEQEVLRLRETCTELTKKLEDIKAESDTLNTEKKILAQERESFEELKKLLDDEIKSHQEEYEALASENIMLQNKCDILNTDVKNFDAELIESHKTIIKLRKDITKLEEAASTVDVYKAQNDAQAKDILHMFDIEQNYLEEIERLSNENEKLRKANEKLKTQDDDE